ncbi:MAG: V-type ATP synthase subunit I [Lachnospiraceae bacterium]|nr:V-type ATP synthase subunit I [Lachnospiraceae bacterium]
MAVVPVQRIEVCALKTERKSLLETLQRLGVVEITDAGEENDIFSRQDFDAHEARLKRKKQTVERALEILKEYAPEKSSLFASLHGKQEVPVERYDAFAAERRQVIETANRIVQLKKTIDEDRAERQKTMQQADAIAPWEALDLPLNYTGTKKTAAFVGSLPGQWTEERLYGEFAVCTPFTVQILGMAADQTFLLILCLKSDGDAMYELLRAHGFAKPQGNSRLTPKEQMSAYQVTVAAYEDEIAKCEEEIKSLAPWREKLKFYFDYEGMRAEKYEVLGRLLQSGHTFIVTGYIPQTTAAQTKSYLEERYTVGVQLSEPAEDEDVPVVLKNNGYATPLESVTEGFSLPGKGEIDPTFMMSLFYYCLFGIMFSDAGYGLIMVIACGGALLIFKNMEDSTKNFVKMFLFCGVATTFWGFVFGSFFGDVVDVIALQFFGKEITFRTPLFWFSPSDDPMRMLVFSMVLGLIHIFTGLALKFYQSVKNGDAAGGFYDGILWILLVASLVVFLLSTSMFTDMLSLNFTLPSVAGTVGAVIAVISAVGIVATGGRESKNPGKRIMKGAYSLYGITSYLSDILSYSRLLALGLATGVIGTVINQMGTMAGSGFTKLLVFIPVFLFGHALNFAINALGAYVHTNRLQYVEFFGKFYEGGGRKFAPFKENTKYYKIKENVSW